MDHTLLSRGATYFDVDAKEITLLGGFSDNVFECIRNGESFILKFYPSTKYKKDSIKAELDWIRFLHKSGVNVTAPIPSINGNYLEIITGDTNEECYVLAFEKAKGTFVNTSDPNEWNNDFFYNWGKTLGKLHFLSKTYKPLDGTIKKQEWNQGLLFTDSTEALSEIVAQKWGKFISEIEGFPKERQSYGMIHNDLHQKNFYIKDGEIVLFDFGDCEYNWFIYDIAIVLYHVVETIDEKNVQGRIDFARVFLSSFLQGYNTENKLDEYWLSKIPFFLNYRQIFSYIYFVNFLSEEQKNNAKVKEILSGMRNKIENDVPYLDIEYIENLSKL
ncbi:phosphotransferase enzyme family protein [Fredinandcohnia humi]